MEYVETVSEIFTDRLFSFSPEILGSFQDLLLPSAALYGPLEAKVEDVETTFSW